MRADWMDGDVIIHKCKFTVPLQYGGGEMQTGCMFRLKSNLETISTYCGDVLSDHDDTLVNVSAMQRDIEVMKETLNRVEVRGPIGY